MTGVPVSAEGPSHPRVWPAVGDRVVWNPGDEEDLPGTVTSVAGHTSVVAWDQGDEFRVYNRHLRPLTEESS